MTHALGADQVDDVLTSGSERSPSRMWSWLYGRRLLLGLLAVLLVAALAADQWQQRREMEALLTQVTAGEQTIDAAAGSLQVVLDYYTPVLYGPGGGGVRDSFTTDIAEAATKGLPNTRAASADVASVAVLPWHRALRQARTEYQVRVDAWTSYLTVLTSDPWAIQGSAAALLPSTTKAHVALTAAIPRYDQSAAERIDGLLAP